MSAALRPAHTEGAVPSSMPFDAPKGDLFPPICIKSHWDPTAILRHVLPDRVVSLPTDFRPWTKVCKKYVTSGPAEVAPLPPRDMVFPSGGEFYAPGRYSAAIDAESSLRTLDHKLDRWCTATQYIVSPQSTMYKANYTVPRSAIAQPENPIVSELAMPQALLRTGPYYCRAANDAELWKRSGRLFNNPTKQDKFGAESYYDETREYPHGGVVPVRPTAEAAAAAWPVPMPGGSAAAAHGGIKPVYERPLAARQSQQPVGVNSATWQAPA